MQTKNKVNTKTIRSSREAALQMQSLSGVWSRESLLHLKSSIFIAELLERILAKLPAAKVKKLRKSSAWQRFLGAEMRAGRSIQQAASNWSAHKRNSKAIK